VTISPYSGVFDDHSSVGKLPKYPTVAGLDPNPLIQRIERENDIRRTAWQARQEEELRILAAKRAVLEQQAEAAKNTPQRGSGEGSFVAEQGYAASDEEISLFDLNGRATAYIANDLTIYFWDGKPVAYLEGHNPKAGLSTYGFDGKHLGWLKGGVLYDHDGKVVAGIKTAFITPTAVEPLKRLKELKPLKTIKEIEPLKPFFSNEWSDLPLKFLLKRTTD